MRRSRCPVGVRWVVTTLVSLLATLPVRAIITGAGSFDCLVGNAEIVVKAKVVATGKPAWHEVLSFDIEPIDTLKAGAGALPRRIHVEPGWPVWPDDLKMPYRDGQVGIFFLSNDASVGRIAVTNNQHAILPASAASAGGYDLRGKLFRELSATLRMTTDDAVRARLLVLLSQVATPAQADLFRASLARGGTWEWRGAMAALLRLDPAPRTVEIARRDTAAFLRARPTDADARLFADLYEEVLWQRF